MLRRGCLLFPLVAALPAQTQFVVRTPALVPTLGPDAVAVDVDGDGDLDVFGWGAFLSGVVGLRLLVNGGSGQFTDATSVALPPVPAFGYYGRVLAFDVDGDGDADLLPFAGTVGAGGLRLWRNNGNGTFVTTPLVEPGGQTDAVAVDVDADGDLDVVTTGNWLTGIANRLFVNQGGALLPSGVPTNAQATSIATIDLEGDGDQDLLLGGFTLTVLRNGGGLTDVTAQWLGGLTVGPVGDPAIGDVDGDGDGDVVIAGSGSIRVLRNTGTSFVLGASLPAGGVNDAFRIALVDADEDGDLDLWRASQVHGVELALGDGLGGFVLAPARQPPIGAQNPTPALGDFDDDGDVDLLLCEFAGAARLVVNRQRDLVPGQPVRGQPWNVEVASQPGYATLHHPALLAIALQALPQPVAIAGFGRLGIDLGGPVVFAGATVFASTGTATFSYFVPNDPALLGLPLFLQALLGQAPWPARLSAWHRVVVQ